MKSLIDKNKQISLKRKEYVEHNFEAMIGARKRRYNDTSQQKQRTEFFEDYYLLYTRTKTQWQKLKEWLEKDIEKNHKENEQTDLSVFLHYIAVEQCILQKMQELEGEDE